MPGNVPGRGSAQLVFALVEICDEKQNAFLLAKEIVNFVRAKRLLKMIG